MENHHQYLNHHKNFLSDKLGFKKTIFEENGELLAKYKGINLSGGYPEWNTANFVKEALSETSFEQPENHYSQCAGHYGLRKVIASTYQNIFKRDLDADKNVIIGEGGTGLIFQIFYSLIKPGDEVIIFQPFFQYFYFNSKMAGATLRFYELETLESKWVIDFDRLEALFNEKTKLIIINSPHNPTGKVFTSDELLSIRKILKKFPDVIVLSDEVYEKCVYDDMKYCRMGEFEDMWDRTITILSSGKTFNVTGWRVGYAIADEKIINCMIAAQRASVFCVNRPCSAAVAKIIPKASEKFEQYTSYYHYHNSMLQNSKDLLIKGLSQFPEITLYPPNGGYFFIINIEKLIPYIPKRHFYKDCNENRELKDGLFEELDKPDYTAGQACFYWLAKEIGINIIPLDSFYENEGKNAQEIKGGKLMRVSVCTKESSIAAALEKLGNKLKLLKTNIKN